jgi:malonate decarboxylase delta subunit
METLKISCEATKRAGGSKPHTITGVVASGDLEILLERILEGTQCEVTIKTPITGFDAIWHAVVNDFIERYSPG